MKLPNDLIKATDYSKAKDREIHEFEYRNGKYIHKYVLGGEHELTPQEIVDCLNAISTIDCDLQTAYAYIQGQKDKIDSLENNIIDDETLNTLVKEHKLYKELETKLAESEKRCDKQYSKIYSKIQRDADYIYKLKEELEKKEDAIATWQTMYESVVQTCHNDKEEIERLNKQLATQENTITNLVEDNRASQEWYKKQLAEKDEEIKVIDEDRQFKAEMWTKFADKCKELEKQLAETETQNKRVLEKLDLIVRSNQELEQKLAEKEQTIEEINKEFVQAVKDWKSLVEKKNKDIVELEEHDNLYHNQLAIEQLEKVKETFTWGKDNGYLTPENAVNIIDNQIKQLKEMK